jgi:hypothetical protein
LRVLLVERDDLASHTSSASSKLIHGGLRYLEQYEFRLVRESLHEREVLLKTAPHLVRPLRFILPDPKGGRPWWLIRLGLWLYGMLAGRSSLPSPRALFASILSQLRAAPSSSTPSRQRVPDKPSDFVPALRDALAGVVSQGENVYLVFDNLEVVRGWDKGGQLVSLLLRLHDLLRLPQVVLVYVSSAAPDAYYTMTGSVEPNHVYFPDYTVDEVHGILMRGQPNPKLYSSFLR